MNTCSQQVRIVDIYRCLLTDKIRSGDLVPHLHSFLDKNTPRDLRAVARDDERKEVNQLLDALIQHNEPGWFRGFITALEKADYSYLSELLQGIGKLKDEDLAYQLIATFLPQLMHITCTDLLTQLVSSECLTNRDCEIVRANNRNYGETYAVIHMIQELVPSKSRDWFPKFITALNNSGYEELAALFEPKLTGKTNETEVIPITECLINVNKSPNLVQWTHSNGACSVMPHSHSPTDGSDAVEARHKYQDSDATIVKNLNISHPEFQENDLTSATEQWDRSRRTVTSLSYDQLNKSIGEEEPPHLSVKQCDDARHLPLHSASIKKKQNTEIPEESCGYLSDYDNSNVPSTSEMMPACDKEEYFRQHTNRLRITRDAGEQENFETRPVMQVVSGASVATGDNNSDDGGDDSDDDGDAEIYLSFSGNANPSVLLDSKNSPGKCSVCKIRVENRIACATCNRRNVCQRPICSECRTCRRSKEHPDRRKQMKPKINADAQADEARKLSTKAGSPIQPSVRYIKPPQPSKQDVKVKEPSERLFRPPSTPVSATKPPYPATTSASIKIPSTKTQAATIRGSKTLIVPSDKEFKMPPAKEATSKTAATNTRPSKASAKKTTGTNRQTSKTLPAQGATTESSISPGAVKECSLCKSMREVVGCSQCGRKIVCQRCRKCRKCTRA